MAKTTTAYGALSFALMSALLLLLSQAAYGASGSSLDLRIVEDNLKYKQELDQKIASDLEPLLDRLKKQRSTYESSGCEGAADDESGCGRIRSNLIETLKQISDQLLDDQALPEVEKVARDAAEGFRDALGSRANMSPRELQTELVESIKGSSKNSEKCERNPRSFECQLIILTGAKGGRSEIAMAATVYKELDREIEALARLQSEIRAQRAKLSIMSISNSTVMEDLVNNFSAVLGIVNPDSAPAPVADVPDPEVERSGEWEID